MKRNEYIHGLGMIKADVEGKGKIDKWAAAVWIAFIILFAWSAIREYRDAMKDRRIDIIELTKGPATPTEWVVSRGKMFISPSPYTLFISINGWQIVP